MASPIGKYTIELPDDLKDIQMPNEFVTEAEKNDEWYLKMNRYYSTFYNPLKNNFDWASPATDTSNSGPDPVNYAPRIADMMVNNFSYLVGEQPNVNYRYLEQDASGRTFSNPWIKGRTAGMLIDFAHGSLMENLDYMRFDAESRSRDVIQAKNDLFRKIEMAFDLKSQMEPFAEMGMGFKPYNKSFERKGDIVKERKKFRDKIETMLIDIVTDINAREQLKMKIADGYLHSLCGLAAFHPYVINGKVRVKVIPCYNTIWDNRVDDCFGDKMRFWGWVEYKTAAQIISENPTLPADAMIELAHIANNNVENITQFTSTYNGTTNFANLKWWNQEGNQWMIACVKMFHIGPRDLRFKKVVDGGKESVKKMKDDTEHGDYIMQAIHTSENIGNRWITKTGYVKNQLRDFYNKGNPTPNMFFFIPRMIMGTPHPVMNNLKKYQDEIDRIEHKIREISSRDFGKIPIINASVMGEGGKSALDFSDDLKNLGILVARTSAEFMQLTRDLTAVQVIDLSANTSLINYLQLKAQQKAEMFQTVGKSEIALGQQKSYVSGQVQDTSMSLGDNVMKYQVTGFFECVRRLLQYCGNVQKMLIGSGKDHDGTLIVGEDGMQILKSLGERRFEDVMLNIKFVDGVDEETRKIILAWGVEWARNPQASGVLPQDMLALLKEKSVDRMITLLEDSMERNKMEAQKEQQYKDMIAQLQQQVALKAQGEMVAMQEQGKDKREAAKLQQKTGSDILKHAESLQGSEPAASAVAQ